MLTVYLGNRAAIDNDPGPGRGSVLEGKFCTTVRPPEDRTIGDLFTEITAPGGLWAKQSAAPPAWVAVDGPAEQASAMATLLAAHWGCDVRDPDPEG